MSVRLSQIYTQVVGTPDQSTACLTCERLYVDVLVLTYTGPQTFNKSSNHTLSLTDTAVAAQDRYHSVSHVLGLTSLGGRSLPAAASSVLNFYDVFSEFNYVDDRKPAGNTLNLTQTVIEQNTRTVPHDLGITQTVIVKAPFKPVIHHFLGIYQHVNTPHRAFVTDALSIAQFAGVPLPTQCVTSTLNFAHDSPIGHVTSTLSFIQTVTHGFALSASQNIGVTDQVAVQGIFVRDATHSNFIGHALTWYEDGPCERKQYTPFQGENTIPNLTTTSPADVLQDPQGDTGNFSLYIPYSGVPTNKVTMRKPEMDNRDRNAFTRINHETRGGKLVVFADPQWPNVRTLAVTIIGLTETEVDEFQSFMTTTLGQEIGLTDWEGRLWNGIITNPNEAATQDGKARWTVTFEFEGEMTDIEQPGEDDGGGTPMNLTQSVSVVVV